MSYFNLKQLSSFLPRSCFLGKRFQFHSLMIGCSFMFFFPRYTTVIRGLSAALQHIPKDQHLRSSKDHL
jgi:hypothetical protein